MTYKINGVALSIQPTSGRWNPRKELGTDGENRTLYEPTYTFTMRWDYTTQEAFKQFFDFWNTVSSTGTVTMDLPQKDGASYIFSSFTNCILDEPKQSDYFEKHTSGIEILVRNITR